MTNEEILKKFLLDFTTTEGKHILDMLEQVREEGRKEGRDEITIERLETGNQMYEVGYEEGYEKGRAFGKMEAISNIYEDLEVNNENNITA